jgi:hypothetical protein
MSMHRFRCRLIATRDAIDTEFQLSLLRNRADRPPIPHALPAQASYDQTPDDLGAAACLGVRALNADNTPDSCAAAAGDSDLPGAATAVVVWLAVRGRASEFLCAGNRFGVEFLGGGASAVVLRGTAKSL